MGDDDIPHIGWDVVGKLQEARFALFDALEGAQDLELNPNVVSQVSEVADMLPELIVDVDQAIRDKVEYRAPVTPLNPPLEDDPRP